MSTLPNLSFFGKKVLITAGPTYEKIDPVRFIGNYSSGKMGYALAEVFADMGAEVYLISGPVALKIDHPNVKLTMVESANQMFEACLQHFDKMDIAIMAAAVADYRPAEFSEVKIKKNEEHLTLHLVKNPDIISSLGHSKKNHQIVIGFALETNNELDNAKLKLNNKKADAIVLNTLNTIGAGFQFESNQITIILKNGAIFEFPLKSKTEVAKDIAECVLKML